MRGFCDDWSSEARRFIWFRARRETRTLEDAKPEIVDRNRKPDEVAVAGKVAEIPGHVVDVKREKQNTRLHCESACNVFEKSRKQDNELTETGCSNCPTDVRMFSLMVNPFLRPFFPHVKFETSTLHTVFSQISNKHIIY